MVEIKKFLQIRVLHNENPRAQKSADLKNFLKIRIFRLGSPQEQKNEKIFVFDFGANRLLSSSHRTFVLASLV